MDLDPNTYERIRDLLAEGKYDSVDQFLRAAADNQLSIEGASHEDFGEPNQSEQERRPILSKGSLSSDGLTDNQVSQFQWNYNPDSDPPTRSPFPLDRSEILLFSQYYRFVPLKFAMVELGEFTAERGSPVNLDEFREHIQHAVKPLRDALVSWETKANVKKHERYSTGFPKRDSKNPKRSMVRYLNHYVGKFQHQAGEPAGLGHQLGFVSIRSDDDGGTIALTPAGRRFLAMDNPLLADGPDRGRSPLSDQEREYLVTHIRRTLSWEYDFIEFVYDTIDQHEGTYTEHMDRFRMFLKQAPNFTQDPSDNRVRSHTAGTISRMVDLGLLKRGNRRGEYVPVRPPEAYRFQPELSDVGSGGNGLTA